MSGKYLEGRGGGGFLIPSYFINAWCISPAETSDHQYKVHSFPGIFPFFFLSLSLILNHVFFFLCVGERAKCIFRTSFSDPPLPFSSSQVTRMYFFILHLSIADILVRKMFK